MQPGTLPHTPAGSDLDPGSWPTFFLLRQPRYGLSLRAGAGPTGPTVGPALAPAHRLTGAGTPEPCASLGRSTPGTHRHAHARVPTARACSRAHGRTGIQAWLSAHTHSTCRQLLASTRAPQRSHTNRTLTRLPAHPCLAVCRMEPGALNFPTVEPPEEPKAAPGRGLARGPQSLPCEGSPLRSQSLSEFGGSGRIAATRSRSGAAPRDRHCHLAVRTSPGGGCSPP